MIYFIGAGPGDPELITVKGAELLRKADVVVYAGSLVNPRLLDYCPKGTAVYNSASMTLQEVLTLMVSAYREGKEIVRLHTGDPGMYGAIQEQLDILVKQGIPVRIVPGVSSVFAAAAAIKRELTLPEVCQTVILTRASGRTSVPVGEELVSLAGHQSTMAIFLSVQQIEQVVSDLIQGGYPEDTPAAVVQKASWPDEVIVRGSLKNIAAEVRAAAITRTAMILVGQALASADYHPSKLYSPEFSHGYRESAK